MTIGIMGTPLESSNLGCMALTYSLLIELEKISKRMNEEFQYIIFDGSNNVEAKREICEAINIKEDNLISGHMAMLYNPLRIVKNILTVNKMIQEIKKSDCVIDITGGDSFSDIYGKVTFFGRTNAKILITKMRKPLLLAPQTYGPFQTKKTREKAKLAIKNAGCVMARDPISCEVVKDLTGVDPIHCADMAFLLPWDENRKEENGTIRVGINVSKLLYMDDLEVGERNFTLKTDYSRYIDELLCYLTSQSKYEVIMIPHVGLDHEVHIELQKKFPTIKLVEPMTDPIKMKSKIAEMDVFLGSRMHGTIAALTAGIACIPVAYSRKFSGLFSGLGYDTLVDLQSMDTNTAINKTIDYLLQNKEMERRAKLCRVMVEKKVNVMDKELEKWVRMCAKKGE